MYALKVFLLVVAASCVTAQQTTASTNSSTTSSSSTEVDLGNLPSNSGSYIVSTLTGSDRPAVTGSPTVSYINYTSTQTLSTIANYSIPLNTTTFVSTATSRVGNQNTTAVFTTTAIVTAVPQKCNNYAEFCHRKYSNITEVTAHNSPFDDPVNPASNQRWDVSIQLRDGIRMVQGQTHLNMGILKFCHTSCELLDAGPVVNYLQKVVKFLKDNPNEVVTVLLGNGDFLDVGNFTESVVNSGLLQFAFIPPKVPMGLDDWPTLGTLINIGKRAVIFMDYNANQNKVPYILDQFSQLWETPFSPTNPAFPCNVDRPPGINDAQAKNRLYMANHNLNTEIKIGKIDLLVPSITRLSQSNALTGPGSLGAAVMTCDNMWGRPPNFLLVDYYNNGDGSVFAVAAKANNVTYDRRCCGWAGRLGVPILTLVAAAVVSFLSVLS